MRTSNTQAEAVARLLLRTVMLVMRTVAAEMRRSPNPIAPPQMGMLMAIDAAPATLSRLARAQAVTLPTVSKAVDILVRQGWVARWVDNHDRRQTIVRLTPAGRRALAEIKLRMEQHVAERLRPLSARQRDELAAVMDGLAGVLSPPGEDACEPAAVLRPAAAHTGRRRGRVARGEAK